jgi:hypothetical protein
MKEYAGLGMEHVQVSLLTDEPAQFVESTIANLVPRLGAFWEPRRERAALCHPVA